MLEALRRCGFVDAVGLSGACITVSDVIEEFLEEHRGQDPLISSFCPTVVRLVQVKYPTLLDQLLPVLSPREVVARDVKRRKVAETGLPPERIGVVYITPCPAKMVELVDHPGLDRSNFDSIVSIRDLYLHLMTAIVDVRRDMAPPAPRPSRRRGSAGTLATGLTESQPCRAATAHSA